MKVVAIVQARMGSKRLPQKVMKAIVEKPMIELLLRRLSKSSEIDEIVLATSEKIENEPLINFVNSIGFSVMKGSEEDVLDRFLQTALNTNADIIVRITGDCPLVDPSLVDKAIKELKLQNVDNICIVDSFFLCFPFFISCILLPSPRHSLFVPSSPISFTHTYTYLPPARPPD